MKENLLLGFFLRMSGVLLISTALCVIGVYWYYQEQTGKQVQALIDANKARVIAEIRPLDLQSEAGKRRLGQIVRNFMSENNFVYLALFDRNRRELFSSGPVPGDLTGQPFNETKDFPAVDRSWYRLLEGADGSTYYLFFFAPSVTEGKVLGYVRAILRLNEDKAAVIRSSVTTALVAVFGTVLFVTATVLPLLLRSYRRLIQDSKALLASNTAILAALGNAVAKRDSGTQEHNYRVTYYSIKLGEALRLPGDHIFALVKGAFLHDVGKIGVADGVLLKPGELDQWERDSVRRHVAMGLDIINDIAWLDDAKKVIAFHHEWFDGSGYPNGLAGDQIPLEARIFAVADVFDALTSARPYKAPLPATEAASIIE